MSYVINCFFCFFLHGNIWQVGEMEMRQTVIRYCCHCSTKRERYHSECTVVFYAFFLNRDGGSPWVSLFWGAEVVSWVLRRRFWRVEENLSWWDGIKGFGDSLVPASFSDTSLLEKTGHRRRVQYLGSRLICWIWSWLSTPLLFVLLMDVSKPRWNFHAECYYAKSVIGSNPHLSICPSWDRRPSCKK